MEENNQEKIIAGGEVNPLKSDAELQTLLKKLGKIGKYKTFQRWKAKFLNRFEKFLYEAGIDPAQKACTDFAKLLNKFVKSASGVAGYIENGDLGGSKKSVKASLALNEMTTFLSTVVSEVETLIPSKSQEEKKKGFTKFHLGAALIRQGFHQYTTMIAIQDALDAIGTQLADVADHQQLNLFEAFKTQVQRFCDVMADLNLYEVMMKCLQFAEAPDEEESSEEEDIMIEISVDTPEGTKRMRLELDPTETIGNIKEAIASDCGIEPGKQVMTFKGQELNNNDASLKSLGIENGSKLKVAPFKVPITVNTFDGKQIKLLVDPEVYISDIKRELQEESGLPAKNQRLFMDGNELDNAFLKADECGIKAGSVLDLEPKSISINVDMPDGQTIAIDVATSDTADSIRAKIADETGMDASKQVLKLNGKDLPNGITVKDMGIQDGSNIKVEVFKVPVTVNTFDGKEIKVMVDPTSYLSDIKRQLENESGVPAKNQRLFIDGEELADDNMKASDYGIKDGSVLDLEPKSITISVEMPDGRTHDIEISPSDTTDSVKAKIAEQTGMDVPRQVLSLDGKKLTNGKKMKDMGVQDGSRIKVEVFKVPVTVNNFDGRQIKVMVDPTSYLSDVKRQLESESGVPAKNQRLIMHNNELDDDNKRAGDYGIKDGSVLTLEPKSIKIAVDMPDGKTHEVEISPTDTTKSIKVKIANATGMAAPRQVLKFNGEELRDGKMAKDAGIEDGSNIQVEVFKVPITVRTMDGNRIKVMVDPTQKLDGIKKQLEGETGIPVKNQRLFFHGDELADDTKTATDYGIKSGSDLDLEPKYITVSVKMPDGTTVAVDVKPSDTSDSVKAKIAEQTGIAVPRQVLNYKGKQFPGGGKTVKSMGIEEGSDLSVDLFTIPITVKTHEGKTLDLNVEPTGNIDSIKKLIEADTGLIVKKQCLKYNDEELKDGRAKIDQSGIKARSALFVDPHTDPIIFVDIKCGTLFAVDREIAIEKNALTPHQNNKLDFTEATHDTTTREKILEAMTNSPSLGVATQVVVEKNEIEDYELGEAEKVKNMWGVNLKKREKNKKGEELIFIDPKTGACGELSRKKYVDMKFITPVTTKIGGETLAEAEQKENMAYDRYIHDIRNVFGVRVAN